MLDRLFRGGESEVDHYELRFKPPSGGSWGRATHVSTFEHDVGDLPNKLEKSNVETTAESEGWRPGSYALQGRRDDGTLTDFLWTFGVEGEGLGEVDEIRRLERKIDQLQNGDSTPADPEQAVEQARAQVALEALGNEEFMSRFGHQVAAEALGLSGPSGVDLDDVSDHGLAALAVDAYNHPERIEMGSEKLGQALSAAMEGFEGDDGRGVQARREARERARREREERVEPEPAVDDDPDPDVARPEARYRLRFPDQYDDEEVAEAREILPDEEVADIEAKRERTEEREQEADQGGDQDSDLEGDLPEPIMPEPADDDAPTEAAADGGEALEDADEDDEDSDPEPEVVADGGVDLLAGTEARVLRPGALGEFVAMFRRDNSREEIEEIAPPWPGGGSKATRDALQAVTAFDGLAFPEGRHGRRRFLENLAEHVLSQPDRSRQPRSDGGHMARQGRLVEFAQANPFKSAAVVIVALLILTGRRGGDRRARRS